MKKQINEIKRMQQLAGIIKESIQQSLEGLSKKDIEEAMEEIKDQIYDEATPEEIEKEENSQWGDVLWDRMIERFEMKFGMEYFEALKQAK